MYPLLFLLLTFSLTSARCTTSCSPNGTQSCYGDLCTCKTHAIGAACTECKPGTVDLAQSNEAGCSTCHCSGHSPSCSLKKWALSLTGESFEITRGEGWVATTSTSNKTTSNYGTSYRGDDEFLAYDEITSLRELGNANYYWVLPPRHNGNWLLSYGANLFYTMNFRCGADFSCSLNQSPWVIIKGGLKGKEKSIQHHKFETKGVKWRGLMEVTVPIHEGYTPRTCWRNHDLKCVTRKLMLHVLSNVVEVRIKAGVFISSYDMALGRFKRELASPGGKVPLRIEVCTCPAPYTGTSCEQCRPGLWHRQGWDCEPCECNGYAHSCDSFTGQCQKCAYDTGCDNCDCCADGFYGKPGKFGQPNPCTPCPCNGRADKCTTTKKGDFGMCIGCKEGYEGQRCDLCADGFYGNPNVGVPCKRCACNGNIDLDRKGNCDNITGECKNCLNNSRGKSCEKCKRGYHGDARRQKCRQCRCNMVGATDNVCDHVTGQCSCKEKVMGKHCNECKPGTFGLQSGRGCNDCGCDVSGTVFGSHLCDIKTGQCTCRSDRQYRACDGCVNGFYKQDEDCSICTCPEERSVNYSCNGVTGDCFCTPGYTGKHCDIAACTRGPWSDWTACSKICGNGTQTRTRRLLFPNSSFLSLGFPAEKCPALENEDRGCNEVTCEVDTGRCQTVETIEPLTYDDCRSRRTYPIKRCSGTCSHGDIVCCQPYLLTQKTYRLNCNNGTRVYHTFDQVEQCGCLDCLSGK